MKLIGIEDLLEVRQRHIHAASVRNGVSGISTPGKQRWVPLEQQTTEVPNDIQRALKALTEPLLDAWLNERFQVPVGCPSAMCGCPIAEYLIGFVDPTYIPSVTKDRIVFISRAMSDYTYIANRDVVPAWVGRFVDGIDSTFAKCRDIKGEQALAILNQIKTTK